MHNSNFKPFQRHGLFRSPIIRQKLGKGSLNSYWKIWTIIFDIKNGKNEKKRLGMVSKQTDHPKKSVVHWTLPYHCQAFEIVIMTFQFLQFIIFLHSSFTLPHGISDEDLTKLHQPKQFYKYLKKILFNFFKFLFCVEIKHYLGNNKI